MTETILSLEGVTKRYSGVAAVQSLNLTVKRGTITGFLGPNGAGKTTSLRMALGILRADEGRSTLFGTAPNARTLDRVGFLPEERGIYKKMKAEDAIVFFARLKGMSPTVARKSARERLEQFGLKDAGQKKIKELSKGMAQKVQIIAALVHDPEFIILDEPFSGLDPVNQKVLESMVRAEAETGKTVLFSTHVMEHAERLCDRIVLIAKGRKVFDGTVNEALGEVPRSVILETAGDDDLSALLSAHGDVTDMGKSAEGGREWQILLKTGSDAQTLLKSCVDGGVRLVRFEPVRAHLHDAFVHLVETSQKEAV